MSPFKDQMNRWFTLGIFKEYSKNPDTVLFSIDEAKKLYLECSDITGYDFAVRYLGGWQHWLALKNSPILSPILEEWEDELEVRTRSQALKQIIEASATDKGYQAAKFLMDKGWELKKAGRPTKSQVDRELKKEASIYSEFDNIVKMKK